MAADNITITWFQKYVPPVLGSLTSVQPAGSGAAVSLLPSAPLLPPVPEADDSVETFPVEHWFLELEEDCSLGRSSLETTGRVHEVLLELWSRWPFVRADREREGRAFRRSIFCLKLVRTMVHPSANDFNEALGCDTVVRRKYS